MIRTLTMALTTFLVFVLLTPSAEVLASDGSFRPRHALVIGIAEFERSRELRNPVHDALDVAERLRDLGFTLYGDGAQINLQRDALLTAVRDFSATVPDGALALVFFAGHGLSEGGDTFLIPSNDRALNTRADLGDHAVPLRELTGRLAARTDVSGIIFVDACSANGLRGQGLGAGGAGDLVAGRTGSLSLIYAAAPGQVAADGEGRNSPFTSAVLSALDEPNRRINDLFYDISTRVRVETEAYQAPWMAQVLANEQPPFLVEP